MKTSCSLVTTLQSSTARPRPRARGVACRASLVVGPAHARVICLFLLRFVPSLARVCVHGCDGGVPTAPLVARFAQSQGRNCAPADWFLNHQRQPSRTTGGRDTYIRRRRRRRRRRRDHTRRRVTSEYTNDVGIMRVHSVNTTTTTGAG